MASSSGSLNTSANNSNHHMFSSSQFMSTSFTDLLSPNKQEEEEEETMSQPKSHFSWGMNSELVNKNIEIPRYKSFPPSSLPLSPPPVSPSSYLSIPPSLSPSILLDSPVLFSSSNVLPSPTTGSFATTKEDERKYSDFSFQSQTNKPNYNSMDSYRSKLEDENFNSFMNKQGEFPTTKALSSKPEQHSLIISQENFPIINGDSASQQAAAYPPQQSQYVREQRKSDDGYNWRKYGQKQVKGSENPRSYFKCTFPNCPTKKKVERNLDGHITEIVYKGSHNHPKPQSTRRSSSNALHNPVVYANMGMPSTSLLENDQAVDSVVTTPENSSTSFGEDEFEQGSSMSNSRQDDENEPEADYFGAVFRKGENDSEGVSAAGSRTVREPRIVVQTTSDIDILDDGCFNVSYRASNESSSNSYMTRWTLLATWVDHFGKTSTGANKLLIELVVHSCRSYYKCTFNGCPVRKHVERASHDLRAVITTYEGKHNHDVPAARGSGSYAMTRPPTIPSNGVPTTIRPAAMTSQPNGMHYPNPTRPQTMQNQTPYTLQMLQDNDSYAFSNFVNSVGPYSNQMQQQHTDNSVSIAKQEPKDDPFFGSFLS